MFTFIESKDTIKAYLREPDAAMTCIRSLVSSSQRSKVSAFDAARCRPITACSIQAL